jgi:hypothetical protein
MGEGVGLSPSGVPPQAANTIASTASNNTNFFIFASLRGYTHNLKNVIASDRRERLSRARPRGSDPQPVSGKLPQTERR